MSAMPATHGHNEACCNVPPVVTSGYEKKGAFEELGGYKTYATGPDSAEKAILSIYDIFGYFDQTIQGADILATSGTQKYKVFMPDWFKGKPCPIEDYPPDTKEKQERLGAFFGSWGPNATAEKIPEYIKAVQAKYPNIKSWGVVGYCWGGKVVSLVTSTEQGLFSVAAECHPAFLNPEDAKGIKIPVIVLASKDESDEDVAKFADALSVPKQTVRFGDQLHGWLAARADLSKPEVKEAYSKGYEMIVEFFHKHW